MSVGSGSHVVMERGILRVATALFFLSGTTGLAYQVIWFKRFSYVWGNSSLAMAAVIASFLCGLGVGAYLLGRLADRVRSPLLWYGVFEGLIGVLALLIPAETQGLVALASRSYSSLAAQPWLHAAARFGLTFVVLGPPCILMGGTLPLLVRQFTAPGTALARSTGWLYGINTLGAALGCYLTGFHILPSIGLFWTNTSVAVLNLAIGVVAVAAARRSLRAIPEKRGSTLLTGKLAEPSPSSSGPSPRTLYACSALTGCAALILEMVWARQLALILGGSTYAFTAMLLLVLVGIGAGSVLVHMGKERFANARFAAPTVIAGLCATTALGKRLIPDITNVVGSMGALRISQSMNSAICVGASALLELLPAMGMGLLFPLLVHLTRRSHREAGRAVGGVYAFNTLGSIAGAGATSVLLIPLLGTSRAMSLALALYFVALFLLSPPSHGWRAGLTFFSLCLVTGVSVSVCFQEDDPRVTNRGAYLYGPTAPEDLANEVLLFRESSSCNVLVTRYGRGVSLRVNGKVDASNIGDMKMQAGSAYVPFMLAPHAKEVLVIGFGSGTTAGVSLLFPDVSVTCCEIEPAVIAASKHFHDVNHHPEASPRFTAVHDDGRSYLQGMERAFDLIISEPSNPWIAGLSNLYSREYYHVVRRRLAPRGILAQWIQTYSFSPAEYALVVRTMLDVFPHASFVRISEGDTLLLASNDPLEPTREAADRAQRLVDTISDVRTDLERYFAMTDVRTILLTHLLLDADGLRRLVGSDGSNAVNTDVNLRLEFDAPLRLFQRAASSELIEVRIEEAASADLFRTRATTLGLSAKHADAFHKLAYLFDKDRRPELVGDLVDLGLKLDPRRPELLADRLIVSPPDESETLRSDLVELAGASLREAHRVAIAFLLERKYEKARSALEVLISTAPESVSGWTNLARAYRGLELLEEAREAVSKALSLDPVDENALHLQDELERTD